MHAAVFSTFDAICRVQAVSGAVLEVGAVPSPDTLLMLPALAAATERVGVNLEQPSEIGGYPILQADAHDLRCFETDRFDAVLCNSVLEHDATFWLSLAEMRRVAKPGALVVIGVPGYSAPGAGHWRYLVAHLARLPVPMSSLKTTIEAYLASTPVLGLHDYPRDYYRFSEQACKDILLGGLEPIEIRRVLSPPRFVAAGRLPRNR
jgi:SAM-dependent methyltransferase